MFKRDNDPKIPEASIFNNGARVRPAYVDRFLF